MRRRGLIGARMDGSGAGALVGKCPLQNTRTSHEQIKFLADEREADVMSTISFFSAATRR
jgi:hypothetical protein